MAACRAPFFSNFSRCFRSHFSLISLLTLLLFNFGSSFEQDFTITVAPGKEECFFQPVMVGHVIDIEFQVIDGGHGNFDIHFGLYNPQGMAVVVDFKKTDGAHRHAAKETGDYKVCFDNTFSHISTKVVFFEFVIDTGDDDDDDEDDEDKKATTHATNKDDRLTREEIYEMTVEEIEEKMNMVRRNLQSVKQLQEHIRAFEARDRNIQERNFSTVNRWSILQLIVMMIVSLIQVIMLRSLFDEKSRVHTLWKKITDLTKN